MPVLPRQEETPAMTFPVANNAAYGYLANPYHRARSWTDVAGGLMWLIDDVVEFSWMEPTARKPTSW